MLRRTLDGSRVAAPIPGFAVGRGGNLKIRYGNYFRKNLQFSKQGETSDETNYIRTIDEQRVPAAYGSCERIVVRTADFISSVCRTALELGMNE